MTMSKRVIAMTGAALCAVAAMGYEKTVEPGVNLETMRDEIRAARAAGTIAKDEAVTVTFAPGEYSVVSNGLVLEQGKDDGITFRAEKQGTVRFVGGVRVPFGDFKAISDEGVLSRLDASVREKVRVADLSALVKGDLKPWPDSIRGVLPGPWFCRNGRQLTVARWPNEDAENGGWSGFENCIKPGGNIWAIEKKAPGAKDPGVFEFPGDRAARWDFTKGVWMLAYWKYDWACEYLRAGSYDPATRAVTMATFAEYGVGKGNNGYFRKRRFYALNLLEELDAPGEWYLDRVQKKLYYLPLPDDERAELYLALETPYFVKVAGARNVRFENLALAYSHGGTALAVKGCDNLVRNCEIYCHAGCAVSLNGERNRVTGCTIAHNASTAVSVDGGYRRILIPGNNLVDRCDISDYAIQKRIYAPAVSISGCGNAIRNCRIHEGPYIALWYYGNEHLIADNTFDRVVLEAGDSGCIYSGQDCAALGTLIFGNVISNLAKTPEETNSRQGIYFDDNDWGDDVIGNTFIHAGRALFVGGGKLHRFRNNLVTECRNGLHIDARAKTWKSLNGVDAEGRPLALQKIRSFEPRYAPWSVLYPQLAEALDNAPNMPDFNVLEGNVFHKCTSIDIEYFDRFSRAALPSNEAYRVNTILKAGDTPACPQKLRLSDAVENALTSPDGQTVADVSLDASAHFSWSLSRAGKPILGLSPLGVTVGLQDTGKLVLPGRAVRVAEAATPAPAFTNVTAAAYNEYRIPLRHLVDGHPVATFEMRVWDGGAAGRWIVPGEGERRIVGENTAFVYPYVFQILEAERPNGYPEAFWYDRHMSKGVRFPQHPCGWKHVGEVVTPWRAIRAK